MIMDMTSKVMSLIKAFTPIDKSIMSILALGQGALLILLWCLSPTGVIPNPFEIAHAWHNLASTQGLLVELFNSLTTIWVALFWSTLITLVVGVLSCTNFFKPISHWITAFRFLGFAGITFLFTLWTDTGSELKIWLLTFGMTAFLLTNVLAVVDSITQEQVEYGHTLRMNGWQMVYEILMRGKLDEILDLIRQNAAIGWTMLSMVEGIVRSEGGIGALLLNQSKHLHLSAIFAIQITILVYGLFQDIVLKHVRYNICPYTKLEEKK